MFHPIFSLHPAEKGSESVLVGTWHLSKVNTPQSFLVPRERGKGSSLSDCLTVSLSVYPSIYLSIYIACYSSSTYQVASSFVGHDVCLFVCTAYLCYAEFAGNILTQTMALFFALTWQPCSVGGSYLLWMMRKYISLSLPKIDVSGFIMQAPTVIAHPYLSCLILLIVLTNVIGTLWDLWNLVWSWCKRKQTLSREILKCTLRHPLPGWQGVWKDLDRFLGWLSPPVTCDFTPVHVTNSGKLTHQRWKGALSTPVKASSFLSCVGASVVPAKPLFSAIRGL